MVRSALISALAILSGAAAAQTPAGCAAAVHHQLDFWVGDWTVTDTAGKFEVGRSHVEPVMGGCGIRESYDAPKAPGGAYRGTSYSAFDRNDGRWHQMYVDTNGAVSWYGGGLEGRDMALTAPGKAGALQKMVYRPDADGSVRQIGTVSTDGGRSWTPGYDYTYRHR